MTDRDLSSVTMERTAIGSSGRVGMLYDGYEDFVDEQLQVTTKSISSESKRSIHCELINGNTYKCRNLLQMIGIETDLRLNILLTSAPRIGIAALINYPDAPSQYTRFLSYTYVNRIEQLDDTTTEITNSLKTLDQNTTATHIITGVSWGINLVVVLQLPSTMKMVKTIDKVLERIRTFLNEGLTGERFSLHDEELLEKIVNINVFSNIPDLRTMTSVFTICQYLHGHNGPFDIYRPLKYFLKPIKCIYPNYIGSDANCVSLPSASIDNLEQHLLLLLNTVTRLTHSLDCIITNIRTYLKEQLNEAEQQRINLKNAYKDRIKRLNRLIKDIRRGHSDISEIDRALDDHTVKTFNDCVRILTQTMNDLEIKGQLIADLQNRSFQYCNVVELNANKEDYEQVLLHQQTAKKMTCRILCSADVLNMKNQSKLNKLRDQLIKEAEINKDLQLIYADFSYCSFQLPNMLILPLKTNNGNTSILKQCTTSMMDEDIINVLLLGESGVGKSTFINAFINYLGFKTLEKAASNEPIVLIPVSFFITTGDNFEDRTIKFGDIDQFNNEDIDHPGQSVTQHCKSYIFHLNHTNGKKLLRIIDTPGFGDTRGLDQDDKNMQHILKYINNLSHLNAICFLLKSDAGQLNSYFRTCITQLFDLLGPNVYQNIVFCFTYARPTFYTPGNTASLLKNILKSFSDNVIPFKKENTFCFDNESFRYLVALQNEIEFNADDREQYGTSWSTSVDESNRLINYINTQLRKYPIVSERQSIKHAQIEITYMIRPMLEAMRNILRYRVLENRKIFNKSIKLCPLAIHRPAAICRTCNSDTIKFGDFFIVSDNPHEIYKNQCHLCSHISSDHTPTDYILTYKLLDRPPNYVPNRIDDVIRQLQQAGNEFTQFFMHTMDSAIDDPFLMGLIQMNIEENDLGQNQATNTLNSELAENLSKLQHRYEETMATMNSNPRQTNLKVVYDWIQKIRTFPEVREQMDAIKQSQQIIMREYQYEISKDLIT